MSEEIIDIIAINGAVAFDDADVVVFEKEGTLSFLDDAAVDSSTTFEGLATTLMRTGKKYRLVYLKVQMMQSENFVDGTTPTLGTRRIDIGINLPGKVDDPSATKQKHPINAQLLAADAISFAGAPGQGDKWTGRFALTDDFKTALFDTDNGVSIQLKSASATGAGADSTGSAGGILTKVTGMLVAKGSPAYQRIFPRG